MGQKDGVSLSTSQLILFFFVLSWHITLLSDCGIFFFLTEGVIEEKEEDSSEQPEEGEEEPQPQAFHKTNSIFLRNLAPSITKQEVEAVSN